MDSGEFEERQARLDGALHQLTLVGVHCIPLIDSQHDSPSAFQNEASNMGILVGHPLLRIQQQQHHVGRLDGLQGLDHGKLLNGLEHFALAAQACGIDQLEFLAIPLERHRDGVPGSTRHVKRHQPLFTQPGVDQRGFAHIRAPSHCQLDGVRFAFDRFFIQIRQMQRLQRQVHQAANTLPVCSGHRKHVTQAQFIELTQL